MPSCIPSSSTLPIPRVSTSQHPSSLLKEGFGDSHFMQVSMGMTSLINDRITGWEILRYKFDHKLRDWTLKGRTLIDDRKEVLHCKYTITGLQNNSFYCFAVHAINSRGKSLLSERSQPTVVDKPLPYGWFRVTEPVPDNIFYTNPALSVSCKTRPDADPRYLPFTPYLIFHISNIKYQIIQCLFL